MRRKSYGLHLEVIYSKRHRLLRDGYKMATIITRKTNYRNHFQSPDGRLNNRFANHRRGIGTKPET